MKIFLDVFSGELVEVAYSRVALDLLENIDPKEYLSPILLSESFMMHLQEELQYCIKFLSNKNSTGCDEILMKICLKDREPSLNVLVDPINESFSIGRFPSTPK